MARPGSRGYRSVARTPQVDETLFGDPASSKRRQSENALASAGAFISRSELGRIQATLGHKAAVSYKGGPKAVPDEIHETPAQQRARARRERLQKIDDDRLAQKAASGEAAEAEAAEARRRIAPRIAEHDKVKYMRSKEAVADALQGRVEQMEEKKRKAAAERRYDMLKHKEAMKIAEREARRDAQAHADRMRKNAEDAAALKVQIEEIRAKREIEAERVIQEGEQMKRNWVKQQEEERKKELAHIEKGNVIRAELVQANRLAAKRRDIVARAEAKEERKAMKWMQEQARKVEAREAAERARKEELERETARLRAMQEKESDKKAEEDEARAKRDTEAYILAQRRRDDADLAAREERKRDQLRMLQEQIAMKEQIKAQERRQDRAYMKRLVKEQQDIHERLRRQEEDQALRRQRAQAELKKQIADNAARSREVKNAVLQERKIVLLEQKLEIELLDEAKRASEARARARGIDDRFLGDIKKVSTDADVSFAKAPAF